MHTPRSARSTRRLPSPADTRTGHSSILLAVLLTTGGCAAIAGHEDKTYDPLAALPSTAGAGGASGAYGAGAGAGAEAGAGGDVGGAGAGGGDAGEGGASGGGNGGDAGGGGVLGGAAGATDVGGSGGDAGTSGGAGTGGNAGTGGDAGTGGSAGTGGNAGTSGSGGMGGSAGASGNVGSGGTTGGAVCVIPPGFVPHQKCADHVGEWVPFVELLEGRQGGFVTVSGSKVYVGGGYTNQPEPGDGTSDLPYATTIESFDTAAAVPTSRVAYQPGITIFADAAVYFNDGLFVADHYGDNLLRCTGDDGTKPGTCQWEFAGPSLLSYRQSGNIVAAGDSLVLWGGQEPMPGRELRADTYNPLAHTATHSPNPRNRIGERVLPLGNNQWLAIAGQTYDPIAGTNAYSSSPLVDLVTYHPNDETVTFEARPSLAKARRSHTATQLFDGRILVVGGWHPEPGDTTSELAWRQHEIIHPDGYVSAPKPQMLSVAGRGSHGAARLPNGQVIVGGGYISGETAELFTPTCPIDEDKEYWSATAGDGKMPEGDIHYPAFVSVPFGVLSIGGELASHPATSRAAKTVWLYCPVPKP
jgi:hypothetical protein